MKYILFALVFSILEITRYIIDVFGLRVPPLGGDPPYLLLPMFVIFLGMIWYGANKGKRLSRIDGIDLLFVSGLLIALLFEVFHGIESLEFNFELHRTAIWCLVFYFFLKNFSAVFDKREEVFLMVIKVITYWTLAHFAILLAYTISIPPFDRIVVASEITQKNGMSHVNCLAIFLTLYVCSGLKQSEKIFLVLPVNFGNIIVNGSRGALIISAVGVFLCFVLSKHKRLQFLTLAILTIGVICSTFFLDSLAEKIRSSLVGLNFEKELSLQYLVSKGDQFYSTYVRNKTNMVLILNFFEHPVIGNGMHDIYNTRVASYMSHTLWLFPFVAYGILGGIPVVSGIVGAFWRASRFDFSLTFGMFVLLFLTLTFTNDVWPWYSIVLFALWSAVGRGSDEKVKQ
jgi:hypothetical protein